jgi:hypothetical protein
MMTNCNLCPGLSPETTATKYTSENILLKSEASLTMMYQYQFLSLTIKLNLPIPPWKFLQVFYKSKIIPKLNVSF